MAKFISIGERFSAFYLRPGTMMSVIAAAIQHCTGGPCQWNKERKRNKRHVGWKGRHKIFFINGQYDHVYR